MTNKLKNRIKNSIHRETYLLMDSMEKTGENYLEDVSFVIAANSIIQRVSPTKELLDLEVVDEIYTDVIMKIKKI